MSVWQAAWVIARRDFSATVYSRSFIFFMLTPLLVVGFSIVMALVGARSAGDTTPSVAVVADSATTQALTAARERLVAKTNQRAMPVLKNVERADDVAAQARALISDEKQGLSAVFSGTLDAPVLHGPERIDDFVGNRMALIVEEAQRDRAIGADFRGAQVQRDITSEAAGNLQETRRGVARFGQIVIFFFTLLLATMLLSNLIEEKSNKAIEVLAASVSLDAVFFGKLLAMLAVSLVGIALWGGMFGVAAAFSVQLLPAESLPSISPAIGWPIYAILLPLYYTTNYMLLGALFMGIGGQANSVREMQSLNMPITFLQMGVLVLAMTVVGNSMSGMFPMIAYIFPFSSPLAMIAEAGQSDQLWPHLLALPWQAFWVFLTIRISAAMFRKTVLKSGGSARIMPKLRLRKG